MSQPRPPLVRRIRRAHWQAVDLFTALVFALLAWGELAHASGPRWLVAVGTALLAAAWTTGRRWPAPAYAMLLAASGLGAITPLLALLAAVPMTGLLYVIASRWSTRPAVAALLLAVAASVAPLAPTVRHTGSTLSLGLAYLTAWTIGVAVRQHRRYVDDLVSHHARLADAEVARARRAVTEERMRIARELHDMVAHSMSIITVQAGFGHLVIDAEPAEAKAALHTIETTGRATLDEMRRLLGVLRADDGPGPLSLAPTPGLADLGRLVDQTARAGVAVDLTVAGERGDLPAGLDLTAYRIVQEALTNVVKHARTQRCRVAVEYEPDAVRVLVTDDGRGGPVDGTGHGLVGMRERVALYGGRLRAESGPGRGFEVAAELPRPAGVPA